MTTRKLHLTRVIQKSHDSTHDLYIPTARAERLYSLGQLSLTNVEGDKWDYATNQRTSQADLRQPTALHPQSSTAA